MEYYILYENYAKVNVISKLVQFDGHNLFHQIQKNRRRGGTISFIKSSLRYKQPHLR